MIFKSFSKLNRFFGGSKSSIMVYGANFNLRLRILMITGFVSSPFLLALSVSHFLRGQIVTATLISIIGVFTLSNSISIFRNKELVFPFPLCYLFFLMIIIWAFYRAGEVVAFWCYPLAFGVFFVFEHRQARIITVISTLFLIPCAFLWMDVGFATRFSLTYILSCLIADLAISLVDDLQNRMTTLAITDPLTGAFNRRHLDVCLAQAAEENLRGFGVASIIALDIDHFKKINDEFGHQKGDEVLKGLVNMLSARKRQLDLVFRTGGDEFMLLIKNNSLAQAGLFAEALRVYIEEECPTSDKSITISLGVVQYQIRESVDEWLQRADFALYESKRLGRNRVTQS